MIFSAEPVTFESIEVGSVILGKVTNVHPKHGVFVKIKSSDSHGLCHPSKVASSFFKIKSRNLLEQE